MLEVPQFPFGLPRNGGWTAAARRTTATSCASNEGFENNTRFIQIQIRSNSGYDVRAVPSSAAATRPRDPLRRGGALLFYHGQNAINNPMHYGGDVKSGVKYLVPWHSLAETAETSLP